MASAVSQIVKATGQGFDEERKILNPNGTSSYLLVRHNQTVTFDTLAILNKSWKNRFSEFRVQMNLQIATEDNDVVIAIRKCSDMSIDGYIYEVDKKDVMPPDGDRPWWDLFGTKTGELYIPTPVGPIIDPLDPLNVNVIDCGLPEFIGCYVLMGQFNGKGYYNLNAVPGNPWFDEVFGFYWGGTTWALTMPWNGMTQGTQYFSFETVGFPYDVVTWSVLDTGVLPLTVVQGG